MAISEKANACTAYKSNCDDRHGHFSQKLIAALRACDGKSYRGFLHGTDPLFEILALLEMQRRNWHQHSAIFAEHFYGRRGNQQQRGAIVARIFAPDYDSLIYKPRQFATARAAWTNIQQVKPFQREWLSHFLGVSDLDEDIKIEDRFKKRKLNSLKLSDFSEPGEQFHCLFISFRLGLCIVKCQRTNFARTNRVHFGTNRLNSVSALNREVAALYALSRIRFCPQRKAGDGPPAIWL
jgi:hypothetical protein